MINQKTGKINVAWVQAWNTFLKELRQWIKVHHTTALTWGGSADAASFVGASPAPAAASGGSSGGPPPPPAGPPPPPVDLGTTTSGGGKKHVDTAALFAEINAVKERQAGGKTEGLRHVTKDMKVKYQDKSALPSAPTPKASTGGGGPKKAAAVSSAPPKLELQGNKWLVEHQIGNREIVISEVEAKQTVYIYKCENSVVQVKGKINAITLDTCKKTGLVFDNCISSVEAVNCNSVQIQITGKVPSILVDKSSGVQLFLSKDCLDVEIVTSKSDEMNVVLPGKNAGDDIEEIAIPEQFKTTIVNRKLVTESVAHV